ncbi:MAG TPA: RDD family protein [Adhaeribacter sp.]|nr:RDD family protein [Adhaeribacter sp.]
MNQEYPSTHNWQIYNDEEPMPTAVSGNVRFLNYLIDCVLVAVAASAILLNFFPDEKLGPQSSIFIAVLYPLQFAYYFGTEFFFGRTLAKMITNCYVTTEFNEKPGVGAILIRTLCRFIPFEYFSFLGTGVGWHDKFSKTYVVRAAK